MNSEDLLLPTTLRSEVTDSTDSPFTDRLLLFYVMVGVHNSIATNGSALASVSRIDIVSPSIETLSEIRKYGKIGLDLSIDKGWMEEIPLVSDRKEMIGLIH